MRTSFAVVSLLATTCGLLAQGPGPVQSTDAQIPGINKFRCGTPTSNQPLLGSDNPDCDLFQTNPSATYAPTTLVRIPVVVHVIQNTAGVGNLSDALVQSQITVLNEDFRAIAGTAGAGGVDVKFEFFLATTDPSGN